MNLKWLSSHFLSRFHRALQIRALQIRAFETRTIKAHTPQVHTLQTRLFVTTPATIETSSLTSASVFAIRALLTQVTQLTSAAMWPIIAPRALATLLALTAISTLAGCSIKNELRGQMGFASGSFDLNFGESGTVSSSLPSQFSIYSMTLQNDGKIVLVGTRSGEVALVRLHSSGALDESFGVSGLVSTDVGDFNSIGIDAIMQPDGKILVAVFHAAFEMNSKFWLVRYNADGSRDAGFGSSGVASVTFGMVTSQTYTLSLQSDGKIILAGNQNNFGSHMARFDSDGQLDLTFSGDGKTSVYVNGFGSSLSQVIAQSDLKTLGIGHTQSGGDFDFLLFRLLDDGSMDATFGSGGVVTTDFGSISDMAYSAAIQPADQKVVLVGRSGDDLALARYNPDGSLDSSFGSSGVVTTDLGGTEFLRKIFLLSNGKILATGSSDGSTIIVRYNSDGSPDTSFSGNGVLVLFQGGDTGVADEVYGLLVQSDGKIIIGGTYDLLGSTPLGFVSRIHP